MHKFASLSSHLLHLPVDDVDTDQIIPARFLTATEKTGLGEHLFADWRRLPSGDPDPAFPLNAAGAGSAQILFASSNFGCGSSREHAAWALMDWGFRAVMSTSFADIFRGNALKNGLLPVVLTSHTADTLTQLLSDDPAQIVSVDLREQSIQLSDGTVQEFAVDAFARRCLLEGTDELEYLLSFQDEIGAYEARKSGS